MRTSLIILLFFVAGLLAGLFGVFPESFNGKDLSTWALYLLMFLVGISIGIDHRALDALKSHGFKLFLVPLATIIGTFAGVAATHLATTNLLFGESLAVGAGFGYYSLSSIIIGELHSEALGVTALLANVMREIITLLMAPFFMVWFGNLAPITAGGATSMDTTLPIITRASGNDFAIVSLFHGMMLTILVPFLVTLIISLLSP